MGRLALILFITLPWFASSVFAGSYQQIDGTIIDPVPSWCVSLGIGAGCGSGTSPYPLTIDFAPGTNLQAAGVNGVFDLDLELADLQNSNFTGAPVYMVNLAHADLSGSLLPGFNLQSHVNRSAYFGPGGLGGTVTPGSHLDGTNFIGASLRAAVMSLGRCGHQNTLNGYAVPKCDVEPSGFTIAYGDPSDFTGADLTDAVAVDANLRGTNFFNATLHHVNFDGADLSGADLSYAKSLGTTTGTAYYDATTNFTSTFADTGTSLFDPVAAGWVFVPEPGTALLTGLGLAWLGSGRKRQLRE